MNEAALGAEKSLYPFFFFQFSCDIKKSTHFKLHTLPPTLSTFIPFGFFLYHAAFLAPLLSFPLLSLSPFRLLSFASASFEVLNNESELPPPCWAHRETRAGTARRSAAHLPPLPPSVDGEGGTSKVRPACSEGSSVCTEPPSSELSPHQIGPAWLSAKANVHARLSAAESRQLPARSPLSRETIKAWSWSPFMPGGGKKRLYFVFFFTLVCPHRK